MMAEVERRTGGLRLILIATAIAGLGGYIITAVVARGLGDDYGLFAIFWSALYLVVGTLSGVQQEITRATQPRTVATVQRPASAARFGLAVALGVAIVVSASSPLWASAVFGASAGSLVVPLTFGAASYVLVGVASGTMYGTRLWRPLALVIVLDVVLRLVFVFVGLVLHADVVALAWATVLPFPTLLFVLWLVAGRRLTSVGALDVGYRAVTANVLRTIAAAAATAILVSGFPLLLGATSPQVTDRVLSAVILSLIVTRAPLVVSTLALQSYLVVFFRDRVHKWAASVGLLMGGIAMVGLLLAGLAYWVGVDVIVWVAGDVFLISNQYLGQLALSSVTTAWIAVSGTVLLARGRHSAYTAGWIVASIATVTLLLVPGDIYSRSLLALTFGPLVGLAIHLAALIVNPGLRSKA